MSIKIKEKYRKLNRWVRAAIIIALLAAFCGGSVFVAALKNDPNFAMLHFHGKLKLNQTKELTYSSDKKGIGRRRSGFPVLYFEPEKNGEYTFTLSDIKSEEGVYLKLMVMDEELSDYINEDNSAKEDDGNETQTDTLSGTAHLNADTGYYVVIEAGETTPHDSYEGSFAITVTEAEETAGMPEINAGETVRISVSEDSRSGVVFRPQEEGFYRFATSIEDDPSGFSSVSAVTTEDGDNIDLYEGICYLEAGGEYYVWVDTDETEKEKTDVDVSCIAIAFTTADAPGTLSLEGETIIEYTAQASGPLAVWSVSDGDPDATVYDKDGTPVGMDKDSGAAFSGNEKDFALVTSADKKSRYYIYVGGEFGSCSVSIAPYTGDGSSIGPDSVEMPASDNEGNETENQ